MFLVFHMILEGDLIKGSYYFMDGRYLWKVTIPLNLLVIGIVVVEM